MRKALGEKRRYIPDEARDEIVRVYSSFVNGEDGEGEISRVFDKSDFGYREIRVERPKRLKFSVNDNSIVRLRNTKAFF